VRRESLPLNLKLQDTSEVQPPEEDVQVEISERKRDQRVKENHHPACNFPATYFGPGSLIII
jgi:hypothetical protein